ncbi:MAG: glucose 1-dehydrogenase [Verrucomicrobiales bacterium]|nr:glucose 1-dehydrogenase [Verrucomicrobiales bacterium]
MSGVLERFKLSGKRALVTGGSRGLGREMALALAEAGADVAITGRDGESLGATAKALKSRGVKVWTHQADATDSEKTGQMCERVLQETGGIDILINNTGGRLVNVPIEEQSLEDWNRIIDLNLTSTFLCTKIIGGAMIARGRKGRIINVASISGMIANRGIGGRSYETSKAAVIQFTKATAADWAAHGITVNAICPGGFMTEPNQRWAGENPEVIVEFEAAIPMGKFGEPEDLGPLAVYLASEASRYMTGASLVIDGGYTLW